MKRGDVILAALPRALGKPRPAVVLQETDVFPAINSLTVLPLSTYASGLEIRVIIDPTRENGLGRRSETMIDKVMTVEAARIGPVIGQLSPADLRRVDRALATFLGFA